MHGDGDDGRGRRGDRRALGLAAAAGGCFALAVAARIGVDAAARVIAERGFRTVDPFAALDAVAAVGACAAGAGVLLAGAALVAGVLRSPGGRFAILLGIVAVALAVGAVVAGIAASRAPGVQEAAGLAVLRTALAGLAAASLPAVVLGAIRSRSARRTH